MRETCLGSSPIQQQQHQQQLSQPKEPRVTKEGEELPLQQCAVGTDNCAGGSKQLYKPRKKNKEDITCWRCKQKGHIQRNCT